MGDLASLIWLEFTVNDFEDNTQKRKIFLMERTGLKKHLLHSLSSNMLSKHLKVPKGRSQIQWEKIRRILWVKWS